MWISWQKSNSDTYHPGPRRGAYVGTAWHRLENERNNARVVGIGANRPWGVQFAITPLHNL